MHFTEVAVIVKMTLFEVVLLTCTSPTVLVTWLALVGDPPRQ